MRWRLSAVALVVLMVSAGCLSGTAPDRATDADAAPTAGEGDAPQNLFLLDGVRPFNAAVSTGAEPDILVDKDGQYIWIGDTSGIYRSANGGASWTRLSDPLLPGVFGDGWSLAQDADGTLYASTTQGQFIGIVASQDGGSTWSTVNQVVHAGTIADRPWVAARGSGEVVVLQNGDLGEDCAYSDDGGNLFLRRALLNSGQANAGNAVFDAAGHLYYAIKSRVYRWQTACQGAALPMTLPASGSQIFTQVAVDADEHVFVAQPSPDNGRMEIRTTLKLQSGTMKTIVVSPPELKANTFGSISVQGDEAVVAWYGSETPGSITSTTYNGAWNVYVARVTGIWSGTPSVTWTRLTNEANHVGDFCMSGIGCTTGSGDRDLLDYFRVIHDSDGNIHVAYGHDGTGTRSEVRYAYLPK